MAYELFKREPIVDAPFVTAKDNIDALDKAKEFLGGAQSGEYVLVDGGVVAVRFTVIEQPSMVIVEPKD